jgi:hypothetical protein
MFTTPKSTLLPTKKDLVEALTERSYEFRLKERCASLSV